MPIYEYRCKKCEEVTEVLQKVGERPKRTCESCGGRLEKLISRSGFVLKGSGWYVTDYGRSGGGGASDREDTGSKSEGKKAAKKSDKKASSSTED